ncbi:hypothetical protein ONS95_012297 [Cadophora gregata]|uniref:uncharacterized protein n=1 Tax=Cadophora gregata TaxID=51156 RepID=UPI0026DCBA3A|nr:uncharacterized protein ONS95_012297 [Cadophora gregata]KAK0117986.1 hypothetical protein ONS95_012297 [Cadophora gregata]KAK0123052.1 hypothetical protein ONS96_010061 [Cadophora gregata f. sp. sojae]
MLSRIGHITAVVTTPMMLNFFQAVAQFITPDNPYFRQWVELEWTDISYPLAFKVPSPLHIAAFAGMTKYAQLLLDQGYCVDDLDGDERTPLHWACGRGHINMVALLLENHAEPNSEDYRGSKPIHGAARKDYFEIVRLLLKAGVDPDTPKTRENHRHKRLKGGEKSTKGETAVQYVSVQGHGNTLLEMLPYLKRETLEELLCRCCLHGKSDLVRIILDNSDFGLC